MDMLAEKIKNCCFATGHITQKIIFSFVWLLH